MSISSGDLSEVQKFAAHKGVDVARLVAAMLRDRARSARADARRLTDRATALEEGARHLTTSPGALKMNVRQPKATQKLKSSGPMANQVKLDLITDAKAVSREINQTIKEVSLLGQAIHASNEIAVRTWKSAANSAKEYLAVAGATTEQQLELEVAIRRTEERLASHGVSFLLN